MVEVVEIVKPIVYGAASLFMVVFFGWLFYKGLKTMGLTKFLKRKPKVSDEVLEEVLIEIIKEEKTFIEFAEYISKFNLKKQKEYLEAYYKIKQLEGGVKTDG